MARRIEPGSVQLGSLSPSVMDSVRERASAYKIDSNDTIEFKGHRHSLVEIMRRTLIELLKHADTMLIVRLSLAIKKGGSSVEKELNDLLSKYER
jgi:hypothetical protein